MYFFGNIKEGESSGHFLHDEKGKQYSSFGTDNPTPWSMVELDTRLAPKTDKMQEHGKASIHYKNGWTAIAFWDRTGDKRYASNSVFLCNEVLMFNGMLAKAEEAFPKIFARYERAGLKIELHKVVSELNGKVVRS